MGILQLKQLFMENFESKRPIMALVKSDNWLQPTAEDVTNRYERYKWRLSEIENKHGSLLKFADGHKYYGINYSSKDKGWFYREWAPNAYELYLTGDFNNWDRKAHPLKKNENGDWELFLDEKTYSKTFTHGSRVKVLVNTQKGWHERIPAYIKRIIQDEHSPNFSGQVWLPKKYNWDKDEFEPNQKAQLLIYECHIGMAQEHGKVGNFNEFKEYTLPRIKRAGYNAIQIMAVAEHPYYASFGYHVSNFFAVTSRFGTPEELKDLIKQAHSMGIAVIMDIVHSHTVKNYNEGLNEFDGTQQYFHPPGRGDHPAWDSKLFDYGKNEVLQFLLSNVKFWMQEFHFDGFRFDGVTSMLYFHHGYGTQFDAPEKYFRDGVEFDAITYLQLANKLIHSIKKNAISIAEDVSGMPGLTAKQTDGGIGFDYRLGMGIPDYWVNLLRTTKDEYWNIEQIFYAMIDRKFDVNTIAYAESHDQALVGDKTIAFWLMDKEMYFSMRKEHHHPVIERGIALHKMIRFITVVLGGEAYMNFMGNEFGHPEWIDFPREGNGWSYHYARRQWSLVDNQELRYDQLANFDREMLQLVNEFNIMRSPYPQLLLHDDWHKTIVFERSNLIFVFNFHVDFSMSDYHIPVKESGVYEILLNSDHYIFGGHNRVDSSMHYSTFEKDGNHFLSIYATNRTALVFKKI